MKRPPVFLGTGGSCLSTIVLTISLILNICAYLILRLLRLRKNPENYKQYVILTRKKRARKLNAKFNAMIDIRKQYYM